MTRKINRSEQAVMKRRFVEQMQWRNRSVERVEADRERKFITYRERKAKMSVEAGVALRARRAAYRMKHKERDREYMRAYSKEYHQKKLEEAAGRSKVGYCECCGSKPTNKAVTKIVWDHDHSTGEFRGWICFRCNMVIGLIKDNSRIARKVLRYLERTVDDPKYSVTAPEIPLPLVISP